MLRQGEREVVGFLFRHGAFENTGFDLIEQDATAPAELGGGAEIVEAGGGVGKLIYDEPMVFPWNFCYKLPQKLGLIAGGFQFGYRLQPKLTLRVQRRQFGWKLWPN